ncbi:hypothetical protein PoB_000283600 [Plakobranchus ocellatus]|uniref:Uncharacterized protein n=1 Tax=Plakobranchus ocellatus TaxID=259542 RepID=A0AAV3Y1T0_9GAST|nr:hypothetical protein PoB_000283600 [Plakobranchus ocellatus]
MKHTDEDTTQDILIEDTIDSFRQAYTLHSQPNRTNPVTSQTGNRALRQYLFSRRATDVRPGCKTQRIAPTLRQDASRSRLNVLWHQRNRVFSNMYCWTRHELLLPVWALPRVNSQTMFLGRLYCIGMISEAPEGHTRQEHVNI